MPYKGTGGQESPSKVPEGGGNFTFQGLVTNTQTNGSKNMKSPEEAKQGKKSKENPNEYVMRQYRIEAPGR